MFMYRSILIAIFLLLKDNKVSPKTHFGVAAIPITSLDDLKNLPKKISDAIESAFGGDRNNMSSESTTFKMNVREFEELGIKKGDKVTLEINISNNNDIVV